MDIDNGKTCRRIATLDRIIVRAEAEGIRQAFKPNGRGWSGGWLTPPWTTAPHSPVPTLSTPGLGSSWPA
jgi:hypothetical protein